MPTLDWIGKKALLNHHREVPYHLLRSENTFSVGDPGSGNLLVEGDNLIALKSLLPYYAGQVKCIYIDPPYNTGNENWIYNDAMRAPEIRNWLGKVVGAEAEDLSRHDKWLCMMYPRLQLLRRFLKEDGAIFISIDDHEVHALRLLMDEIFGPRNFIASIIWQKVYSPKNSAKHFSEDHDYIIVYAKNANEWRPNLVSRTAKQDNAYKNPDDDPRGPWKASGLDARNPYSKGTYPITCPSGRTINGPPRGSYWRFSEEKFKELDRDGRIWWGRNRNSVPQLKRFLSEVKQGIVPQTLWTYQEVGHTQEAKQELVAICDFEDSASVFITPKPIRLLKRILEIGSDKDSLVLDSFAGSGTTGHAVFEANKADGGNRRFILVEMEKDICRSITRQRLERAIIGYRFEKAGNKEVRVEGLGGGFRYCVLSSPLLDEHSNIHKDIGFQDIATHVYFTETGEPIPKESVVQSPLLGINKGTAIYLLFNGILGDKRVDSGNVLTNETLKSLPFHNGRRVIYGEGCRLSQGRRKKENIIFKQIPYEIKVS